MLSATTVVTNHEIHDQIHDLTARYDALENQYKTSKLENKEYKHQIAVLHHQNKDLQKELNHYKGHHHHKEQLKPMLDNHINSIQSTLEEHSEQMLQLQQTNQKYVQQLNSLKSENITLTEQIKKYRIALENATKQKDVLKQIHRDSLTENNKQIHLLEDELCLLREQLHSMQISVRKPKPSIVNYKPILASLPERTPIIGLLRSDVETIPFHLDDLLPHTNTTLTSLYTSTDSVRSPADVDGCEYEKLVKLRTENAMLREQLDMLQCNDRCDDEKCDLNSGYDIVAESGDDILNEFDEEEIHELEMLFTNCDQRKSLSPKIINARRHRKKRNAYNWISWYMFR